MIVAPKAIMDYKNRGSCGENIRYPPKPELVSLNIRGLVSASRNVEGVVEIVLDDT